MTTVEETLESRKAAHGEFADVAYAAQAFDDAMRSTVGWDELQPMHKEALEMIVHKIARILSGDPNHSDHWHDIQGYARLVEDRLPRGPANEVKTISPVGPTNPLGLQR